MRTQHTTKSSSGSMSTHRTRHISVLLQEVLEALDVAPEDVVLDATLGGGGHARAITERLSENGTLVGLDADADAVARARAQLDSASCRLVLEHANFRELAVVLDRHGIAAIDAALFDLGLSSDQLEQSGRGFSFMSDEPLEMTFDAVASGLTAAEIVNEWDEANIADVIYGWGGERHARRIARAIVERRRTQPFATTHELADVVRSALPAARRSGRRHPATRTFQALRIATNDELGALTDALAALKTRVRPGGRIAIISFHSLEDRIIKSTFKEWAREGIGDVMSKKPIEPTAEEVSNNPRARSAKLRGFTFTHYEHHTR